MTGRLENKIALVTGASRGMGAATAELFADEGAKVFVNYKEGGHPEDDAKAVAARINKRHKGSAFLVKADVSKEAEVVKMIRAVVGRFARIDILVNNAAIARYSDYENEREADLDAMIATNLKGVMYCCREASAHMIKNKYGKIVSIASIAGIGNSVLGNTSYASTKAAVILYTKRLALELGGKQITVNAVAPGFVRTVMAGLGKIKKAEWDKQESLFASKAMLGRIGEPIDIARAVLFLASDESSFITGQVLAVDGGRMDFLSHSG